MTVQELIVGHYEGSLTSLEETQLQGLLQTSADARSLYEQHGAMQEAMEEESERLVPPIALREATIGAALGIAAESIGGGIGAWLTTKVAIAVGSVIVGGTAIGVILSTSGDDKPKTSPPAATAPAQVNETPVPAPSTAVEATTPNTATSSSPSASVPPSAASVSVSASGSKKPGQAASGSTPNYSVSQGGKMDLESQDPAKISTPPTVNPKEK